MGVKYLNGYFTHHCSEKAVHKCNFSDLHGKTISVDISIYLYKFLIDGSFYEQLYFFLSMFYYHGMDPIFVFDGKPPPEKWPLLVQRYNEKKNAQSKYDELQEQLLECENMSSNEYESTVSQLEELRKKMVKIRPENIEHAKKIIHAFGFDYIEAPCEADLLCAYMVKTEQAWACLSEDMDLFALGCPRVLRNVSLLSETWTLYHSHNILSELNLSQEELVGIIVLSGSDYTLNLKNHQKSIRKMLDLYRESKTREELYIWYISTYSSDETVDSSVFTREMFDKHCRLFEIHDDWKELLDPIIQQYKTNIGSLKYRCMNLKKIQEIMEPHGFLFV